ncbi:MAG: hypothetical protein HC802_12695 [Caldilineaceae bacterium]|nr:hypothetical protein [Caldilineaceae bacterium]
MTATFFAPFFRIPDGAGAPLPPLIPLIAREETLWLALIFAGCMVVVELAILLRALNARLFDALRMGHHG